MAWFHFWHYLFMPCFIHVKMPPDIRCSEPGHRAPVAIERPRGPGCLLNFGVFSLNIHNLLFVVPTIRLLTIRWCFGSLISSENECCSAPQSEAKASRVVH